MKIQVYSDLHLEFGERDDIEQSKDADIVVLAGDIDTGIDAFEWIEKTFTVPVIYVAGNHEHYGKEYTENLKRLKSHKKDIHFLEDDKVTIDGVTFIGSTLWTDFKLYNTYYLSVEYAKHGMSDFSRIRYKDFYMSPELASGIHERSVKYITSNIPKAGKRKSDEKFVIVTHHGPLKDSLDSFYEDGVLNPAYVSDLSHVFHDYDFDLWIHGHVHDKKDYTYNDKRVVVNPGGYFKYEDTSMEKFKIVEI